jgi:hypothetical protein
MNPGILNKTSKWRMPILIFMAAVIATAIISFFLAFGLAPWFHAINTRVRLSMEAPAETVVDICWDERQAECLPLVPYSQASSRLAKSGEIASVWLSELPPRPDYRISLVFRSRVDEAAFHTLELDSSNILLYGYIPNTGVNKVMAGADQFEFSGVTHPSSDGVSYLTTDAGGKLLLNTAVRPGVSEADNFTITFVTVWILLLLIISVITVLLFFLPRIAENRGSAIQKAQSANYPWWVYVLWCVAIGFMLFLVANSPVLLNPYDPMNYLHLATSGKWFSDTRLPGYPLFLGITLWLSGFHLNGVVLFQAGLLAISTGLCAWTLRRWLHPVAAGLFVFLCVLSPAQVHYARWILRESLFASLVLLGMAALIAHFTSRKPFDRLWLGLYALICLVAFLVRENGILFLVALLPVLLAEIIKQLKSPGNMGLRLRSVFKLLVRYSLPFLAIGSVYGLFAGYNYFRYGYFQLELLQTSHHFLSRTLFTANFDARSLLVPTASMSKGAQTYLGPSIYRAYIIGRDRSPALDPMYESFFPSITQAKSERGLPANIFQTATILDEIGLSSIQYLPWQANLAGLLRQFSELFSLNSGTFFLGLDDPAALADKKTWLGQVSPIIQYDARPLDPGGLISGYYNLTQAYNGYGVLVILALLCSAYILRCEDPLFLAPITFFVMNAFFLILSSYVYRRFFVVLDILLILQIALGLSLWLNGRKPLFQKSADPGAPRP